MNKVCSGCGSLFQSLNPQNPGYIKKDKLVDGQYCERCFKIIHYGESLIVDAPKDIDKIIDTVNEDAKHSLFLVDFLSLNNDMIEVFKKINYPKTLIINKSDLFKNIIKPNKIINYLKNHYQIKENVIFISIVNHNVSELLNYLHRSNIKEAYLLGFVNVGKSSLINYILQSNGATIMNLTTSYIPHTTMNFINIKINENLTLIDSPGFTYPNFLDNNLDLLKKLDSKKRLKPVTYQMKENESLIIDKLLLITFLNKTGATVYMSNKINLDKDYKVNHSDLTYHILPNSDLVIKGVGFINIKSECDIEVNINDESMIEIRPSIFRGDLNE